MRRRQRLRDIAPDGLITWARRTLGDDGIALVKAECEKQGDRCACRCRDVIEIAAVLWLLR